MKQLILAVLLGLVIGIPTITSQTSGFSQIGRVSQGIEEGGYFIAHSSLPLNSKAKIVNTSTGKELEVTVIRQIPASPDRIADVSSDVGWNLELGPDTKVRIYTNASGKPPPRRPRVVTPVPVQAPTPREPVIQTPVTEIFERAYDTGYDDGYDDGYFDGYSVIYQAAKPAVIPETKTAQPAPVVETRQEQTQPVVVSDIWAQVAKPAELKAPVAAVKDTRTQQAQPAPVQPIPVQPVPVVETRQALPAPVFETRTQGPQTIVINEPWPQTVKPVVVVDNPPQTAKPVMIVDNPPQAVKPVMVVDNPPLAYQPPIGAVETRAQATLAPPQIKEVVVTPGLPNPRNGKTYLLQVGAYATTDTAAAIARQLDSSGFKVAYESAGSMHRILIRDIPAAMVYDTAQSLGAFGIEEVWLRE
jgi:hypothetical protein